MLGVVFPVSLLAIVAAVTFAFLFFKYKRRYAVGFWPLASASDVAKEGVLLLSRLNSQVTQGMLVVRCALLAFLSLQVSAIGL